MSAERIAIIGIGLRYPDAGSPDEVWENALAGRRAFRRLPEERMRHADYISDDPLAPDRAYADKAAVLRDYEFDRTRFRIAGSTYRATDLTHWLALDVASNALADAGFPDGEGLPRATTGVVVGNSLTGEFTRAQLMRLRWPYVRRSLAAALTARGWEQNETAEFLAEFEADYKSPFPSIGEDSLAGGLANTIAGRICNHFDFAGGGYTVDGACSSSLLSVATAATALTEQDLDVAIAGGVDLSIDPFEVIGFAKTGALATSQMKVYDRDSNGFWPGEGSGMLVLMREDDAVERGLRIYARITGWGVSSDGKGGITRPTAEGHQLALERAYQRAGYGVETVGYFEGHGTGTALGDATEITALSTARREAADDEDLEPVALSSIKGNIGHTKAAAGVAGLIKATLAVHNQLIPPGTGQQNPHPLLEGDDAVLYVPQQAELWPAGQPVRAGVSAMGFGGINTHIAIEQVPGAPRRDSVDSEVDAKVRGRQDAELLLFDAKDFAALQERVREVADFVPKLSFAELTDLAAALADQLSGATTRAAVVVTSPADAAAKLTTLLEATGSAEILSAREGIFVSDRQDQPSIGFLFPGQGSGRGTDGALRRRFAAADEVFRTARVPSGPDQAATEVAQPRIVAGSLAAMRVLADVGVEAVTATGHSLGELMALHWGGALTADQVLELATVRGRVMAEYGRDGGAMASLNASADQVSRITGTDVVIAGYNGPDRTVVSGPAQDVERCCDTARSEGLTATTLTVSHAFHSPLMDDAAAAMAERLTEFDFARLARPVLSTVTGDLLGKETDLRELLPEQIRRPVRFADAAAKAAEVADMLVEVGPGRVLTGLLTDIAPGKLVLPTDTDGDSLTALLRVVAAAFALGAPVRTNELFAGRVVRPLPMDGTMSFLASPCEEAPTVEAGEPLATTSTDAEASASDGAQDGATTLQLLCKLVAERVELPQEAVTPDTHPLDDLHLSSITVGQVVNEVTREQGRPALQATPNFATVRIGELATMIDELADTEVDGGVSASGEVPGVAPWVRTFALDYVPQELPDTIVDIVQSSEWKCYASDGHPLAEPLRDALASAGLGDGVLLCLPDEGTGHIDLILEAGRAAVAAASGRFVVVQQRFGAAGVARTLHLEAPAVLTTVVDLADELVRDPDRTDRIVDRVVAEVRATTGYAEARYDDTGSRAIPVLQAVDQPDETPEGTPLTAEDVLLVTGGGKGITAECALAIAKASGARLALLGRADPAADSELGANLSRMESSGVTVRYERADVTSADAIRTAVGKFAAELGPVTAILYGAGRNEPAALENLSADTFHKAVETKVDGLRTVLSAVDEDQIKLLVTFGSIIGRGGLRGEAHYACANDWLTEATVRFQHDHPQARAVAIEWSVWSGVGMGERLGVVEALARDGITPISVENGIAALHHILAEPSAGPVVVVSGRTGLLPTVTIPKRDLPLLRFVDRVMVDYPGIELVTEADLSPGGDPYLTDHLLDGDLLFPAVLGMEAMAQAGGTLCGTWGPPVLTDVEFLRPVVARQEGTTIRVAALLKRPGVVDVVVRSDETGFGADHFRATLRYGEPELPQPVDAASPELPVVPVDPTRDLYGEILFQGKRFQRLQAYRQVAARRAVAELATSTQAPWFAAFLPQRQVLADPGVRDAAMHAIQCCVPDATLLPQRIERLHLADPAASDAGYVVLDARERAQDGDSYTYDVDVLDPSGTLLERWEGLVLRAVRKRDGQGPWVPAMLGPYLERALERVLGGSRTVVLEPDPVDASAGSQEERRAQTRLAVSRAAGEPVDVAYRPDGKPEIADTQMSASHNGGMTLVVLAEDRLGCDIEVAAERGAQEWADLIGSEQLPARDILVGGDGTAVASTRVWCAIECLRKAGATSQSLAVDRVHEDGWVVLSAGDARIATWSTRIAGLPEPVVFAVLAGKDC